MNPVVCLMNSNSPAVSSNCAGTYWLVPVESLDDISNPTRAHAYILPDDSVWVLNHDGDDYIQIASAGTGSQPTLISNQDGYITVAGSGTYSVVVGLDAEKVETLAGTVIDGALTDVKTSVQNNADAIKALENDVESLNLSLNPVLLWYGEGEVAVAGTILNLSKSINSYKSLIIQYGTPVSGHVQLGYGSVVVRRWLENPTNWLDVTDGTVRQIAFATPSGYIQLGLVSETELSVLHADNYVRAVYGVTI